MKVTLTVPNRINGMDYGADAEVDIDDSLATRLIRFDRAKLSGRRQTPGSTEETTEDTANPSGDTKRKRSRRKTGEADVSDVQTPEDAADSENTAEADTSDVQTPEGEKE